MALRTPFTAHAAKDESTSSATGGVAISDTASGLPKREFTEFIWGKLNDIDGHLKDLAEKHGRLDEKLSNVSDMIDSKTEPIQKAVEKLEGKVSKLETTITMGHGHRDRHCRDCKLCDDNLQDGREPPYD